MSTRAQGELTPLAQRLVQGHHEHQSWRRRLVLLHGLLSAAETQGDKAFREALALTAIYLRLLGTGALSCAEDGGHYRPNHHARLSSQISALLARRGRAEELPLLRRIWPWLPAYGSAYTRAEPLTRIRDIAHRNDIPSPLKREIKTTLQNKLHRSAGPEDLVTARALASRFRATPEDYPAAFVAEFERFLIELEAFFGAAELGPMLTAAVATRPGLEPLVEALQGARQGGSRSGPRGAAAAATLDAISALRRALAVDLDDASDKARQLRLCDLRLEELSFAEASPALNELDDDTPWSEAVALLHALLVASSLGEQPGAATLAEELTTLDIDDAPPRDALLRLKALLDRCQRLLAQTTDDLLELFAGHVDALAEPLGLGEQTRQAFVEGDLRGRLPFLLSRLVRIIGRRLRREANLSPWIPLVVGEASGELVAAVSLEETRHTPGILLLESAGGDELIPAGVAAILLAHDLPQLSHLGVRARQAGVPFACCDDEAAFEALRSRAGQRLGLRVDAAGLTLDAEMEVVSHEAPSTERRTAPIEAPDAETTDAQPTDAETTNAVTTEAEATSMEDLLEAPLLELGAFDDAQGAKALGAAHLWQLAGQTFEVFFAPPGVVVAAGLCEACLAQDSARQQRYESALERLVGCDQAALPELCAELREVILEVSVPAQLVKDVRERFGSHARLMVRSSSNVEDRDDDAGAGLYDTVANVGLDDEGEALEAAIQQVWASLWGERAALARRRQGFDQRDARMAVLLQPLVAGELSFILHSSDPFADHESERCAYAEVAVGHGEILASGGVSGSPYRLRCDKRPAGDVETLSFASFDVALWPDEAGQLEARRVDYRDVAISADEPRRALGQHLAMVAATLEEALGGPQDIEGVVKGGAIWVVQSRPQQGLGRLGALESEPEPEEKTPALPPLFALLDLQVRGDEALLALGQQRLAAAELGAELYAPNPDVLEARLRYAPKTASISRAMVHLPRDMDLLDGACRRFIVEMARRGGERVRGYVVHDQPAMRDRLEAYEDAARRLSEELQRHDHTAPVHIEYAVCIEPEEFLTFFRRIAGAPKIGACLDVGHVGIHVLRQRFAARHPGVDPCRLAPYSPELPELVDALQESLEPALPVVEEMIEVLGALPLPLHFHLHDGHPLWAHNPYGVSDHMSFLETLPIPFEHEGQRALVPLYGPEGLKRLGELIRAHVDPSRSSVTFEIHPQPGKLPLADEHRPLFAHWQQLGNAERMNHWMAIHLANAAVLRSA